MSKKTKNTSDRNVSLLKTFLQREELLSTVEGILPSQLNELRSKFVLSVRTKDDNDYEPTLLRGMIASFERYLQWKCYQATMRDESVETLP